MRKFLIPAAALVAAASSVSVYGQTVTSTFLENFDDGLAASRWDLLARESGVSPAVALPDASVDFAFDYTSTTFGNYTTGSAVQQAVGAAPSGAGFKGALIHVNDNAPGASTGTALVKAGILPKSVLTTGDYRLSVDLFSNNSNPSTAGSSEFSLVGLNADPTAATVGNASLGIGPALANAAGDTSGGAAVGYGFSSSNDGGYAGDYRIYAQGLPGDDGARQPKRNGAWTGTSNVPIFDANGIYQGTDTAAEEAFNPYYQQITPGNRNGVFTGGIGKNWATLTIEQRGSIVTYSINGKIVNTLFVPAPVAGKISLGAYDGAASMPADTSESYYLYDNVKLDQLATATPNTIVASDNYARFNAGGTQTVNGAFTVNALQFDTAATTLAGTGTLTLGTTSGAIYAAGGAHAITKPLAINADTAVYVDAAADTLDIPNVTFGPGVDFHKQGLGRLGLGKFDTQSLTINSGRVKLLSPGVSKTGLLYFGYGAGIAAGSPADANSGSLDFNRSVVAVNYSNAASVAAPTTPLSPLLRLTDRLNAGYHADGGGLPQWDGPGLVTSAPELLGAGFTTSIYTVRIIEASTLGYTDASVLNGVPIDATTVLFGFTFRADTNLDQAVNFNDLLALAQNYDVNGTGKQWYQGDSTGDGVVNFDDLLALAQLYGTSVTALTAAGGYQMDAALHGQFSADWALAQSLVPEPTSLTLLGLGALALRRRRSR